jgi:hypothetical protein
MYDRALFSPGVGTMPPCLGIDVSENEVTSCDVESWTWRAHRGRALRDANARQDS